jgi:hypothetical protein
MVVMHNQDASGHDCLQTRVESARLREVLDHWVDARGGRDMPRRSDIDPTHMAGSLPYVWMVDHDKASDEFIVALAGDEIRRAWGRPLMRRDVREAIGASFKAAEGSWRRVLSMPAIMHGVYFGQAAYGRVERLVLPVEGSDGEATRLLGATVYEVRAMSPLARLPAEPPQFDVRFYDLRSLQATD